MRGFEEDFAWQEKYMDGVKHIVGPLLLETAPLEVDRKEATDLLVLMARDMRIGCRIRRDKYADRYPWDFTLRLSRDSGATTEAQKVRDGWGDWLFYGHAAQNELASISRWFVVDLHSFRTHVGRDNWRETLRWGKKRNADGTWFIWFDLRSFPDDPPILVSSSHEVMGLK
jgi:hypothetical protein